MTPRRLPAALLAAAALLGAACSDSDDEGGSGAQRQEYVDALEASAEDAGDGLETDERRCVAESFVDGYGPAALADAGVTPDDLRDSAGPGDLGLDFTGAQRDDFYERLTGCMDVRGLMLEALSQQAEDPAELRACLDDALGDDLIRDFLLTGFTEGDQGFEDAPELEAELESVFTGCAGAGGGTAPPDAPAGG